MLDGSIADPFSSKSVVKIQELTVALEDSWYGFQLDTSLQNDVLHLAEVHKAKIPHLKPSLLGLQLESVNLEPTDTDSTCSIAPNQTQNHGNEFVDRSDQESDIWTPASLSLASPRRESLCWERFHNREAAIPTCTYLSEIDQDAYRALLKHSWQNPRTKDLKVARTDQISVALANLVLGRSSLFFKWSDVDANFVNQFGDFMMSGCSSGFTATVCDYFMACGSSFRRIHDFCLAQDKSSPTVHALQGAMWQIMRAIEHDFLGKRRSAQTLLQLMAASQTYSELLALFERLIVCAISPHTEAQVVADIVTAIDEAWTSHGFLRGLLSQLTVHIIDPAIQQTSSFLRMGNNTLGIADDGNWLMSALLPDLNKTIVEIIECYAAARERNSFQSLLHGRHDLSLFVVHDWTTLATVQRTMDQIQEETMAILQCRISHSADFPTEITQPVKSLMSTPEPFEITFDLSMVESDIIFGSEAAHSLLFDKALSVFNHNEIQIEVDLCPVQAIRMSLSPHVGLHHRVASCSLIQALFLECNFVAYTQVLYAFQLLGNGSFAARLSSALFDAGQNSAEGRRKTGLTAGLRLEDREVWPPASSELQLVLKGLLSETLVLQTTPGIIECMSFAIRELSDDELDKCRDIHSIHALDFLRLACTPSNPVLELVITPAILSKYDHIFRFLVILLRMHALTQNMVFNLTNDKSKRSLTPKHRKLCHHMHHFVHTLLDFVLNNAIKTPWEGFSRHVYEIRQCLLDGSYDRSVAVAGSIAKLRKFHQSTLDEILTTLLLKKRHSGFHDSICQLLSSILSFASLPAAKSAEVDLLYSQFRQMMIALKDQLRDLPHKAGNPALQRLDIFIINMDYSGFYAGA